MFRAARNRSAISRKNPFPPSIYALSVHLRAQKAEHRAALLQRFKDRKLFQSFIPEIVPHCGLNG
jgi:hypothetical protein